MANHLFLLKELVKRDFKGRYAGSVLGFVWSLIQPVWLLILYTYVFSSVMRISLTGERTSNFAVFLFAGLLPWMAIQEGVSRASTAITDNATLVKKLSFPSEILILAVVLAALLHEAIAGGIFAAFLLVSGQLSWSTLPLLVLVVPLQVALSLGLGLLLGAVNVFFRDTAQILGMVFSAWFYLTPIVYPLSLVPDRYQWAIRLNPLTALVDLYRQALIGDRLLLVAGTGGLAAVAVVLLCAGLWTFRRLKPAFVDEI